jgi:hypothetical protein
MITYLLQSVDKLSGKDTAMLHLARMPATAPMLGCLMLPARLLRHRHAACRSALMLAALFRRRTLLQQFVVSGPFCHTEF